MSTVNLNPRICVRRSTESEWLDVNPILMKGEFAIVDFDDCVKVKIGNGDKHFRDLDYLVDPIKIKKLEQEINDLRNDFNIYMIITNILIFILALGLA